MNRPSAPPPIQPPGGGPVVLPDGLPAELATMLPPGNLVILGGAGSGETALVEADTPQILAPPAGPGGYRPSSRQAAVASTERLLAALDQASGGELGCVTWHAFARGLV